MDSSYKRSQHEEHQRQNQFQSMMAEIEDSDESEDGIEVHAESKEQRNSLGRNGIEVKRNFNTKEQNKANDSESDDDSDMEEERAYMSEMKKNMHEENQFSNSAPTTEIGMNASTINAMRAFVMRAPKKDNRMIECYVVRNRTGSNMLHPLYQLYLEEGKQFVCSAKKRSKNKTSNYLISLNENPSDRKSKYNVGKLRSNWSGSEYSIYDHGMNPKDSTLDQHCRRLLGLVAFQYDKMGPGKMMGCVPRVSNTGKAITWKDTINDESQSMSKLLHENNTEKIMILKNKRPKYDEKFDGHVLNFHGRVTMSSVKNFQMCCEDTGEDTILQFGRVSCQPPGPDEQCVCHKNIFNMDFKYPLSPLQAFAICLATMDGKIADSKGFEAFSNIGKRK